MGESLITESLSGLRFPKDDGRDGRSDNTPNIIERGHYRYHDISKDFIAASKALRTGQLVQEESFTLFESVAALEIMDPKMDSGIIMPDEILEEPYNVHAELLPDEVLAIMDQMFCYEMAWFQGHPLSQTIFTSLHIDYLLDQNPTNLHAARFRDDHIPTNNAGSSNTSKPWLQTVLRAFSIGVIKGCDLAIKLITFQHYYEEEDFVTHTCNRKLLSDVRTADIIELLHDAIAFVRSSFEGSTALGVNIISRLTIRANVLSGLADIVEEPNAPQQSRKQLKAKQSSYWSTAIDIMNTHGKIVSDKRVTLAFSGKVQRKLASTVPPRPVIEMSFPEASKNFICLSQDILFALNVLDFKRTDITDDLMMFLWNFSSRTPQPEPLSRAMLQELLFRTDQVAGVIPAEDLIINELREVFMTNDVFLDERNWKVEHPDDPRYKAATLVDQFLTEAIPVYFNVLRSLCQNRCRLRRNLQHLIHDFDGLESKFQVIDASLRALTLEEPIEIAIDTTGSNDAEPIRTNSNPLCFWVRYHTLRLAEWYLQLGFEQELYNPEELSMMHLHVFAVAKKRDKLHDWIGLLLKVYIARMEDGNAGGLQMLRERERRNFMRQIQAKTSSGLARGLSYIYMLLGRLDLILYPNYPYTRTEQRIQVRTKPLTNLVFLNNTLEAEHANALSLSPAQILDVALAEFQSEKSIRDSWKAVPGPAAGYSISAEYFLQEQKTLRMSYVAGAVVAQKLKKAMEEFPPSELRHHFQVTVPRPQDCYHHWWLVPSIKPRGK